MKKIMFTKHLEGLDLRGIIESLKSASVEGADLCVRPGYPINPDNMASALPEAARTFAGEGLSIPLVTAPGDFNQPDIEYAERFYAACSDANVDFVKLGYWHWTPRKSYWEHLDEVRSHLEGFEKLSRETGVKTVVHNHSGTSMALHSCAAMNVVKGFDSACIGVFADPGHLSLCGEPIDMALDIVRDYLSVVAFKDLLRQRPGGNPRDGDTKVSVMRMGQGFVNWPVVIKTLKSIDFDGPISFHSEYSGEPPESVVDLCRLDVRFIKSLWN